MEVSVSSVAELDMLNRIRFWEGWARF
jgi:hypothetical protein